MHKLMLYCSFPALFPYVTPEPILQGQAPTPACPSVVTRHKSLPHSSGSFFNKHSKIRNRTRGTTRIRSFKKYN